MSRFILSAVIGLGLFATLPGCSALDFIASRAAIAKANFSFDHVALQSADIPLVTPNASVSLQLYVNVQNPNPITASLDAFDYTLLLENQQVATGSLPQAFSVDTGATSQLVLPVTIPYANLPQAVLTALLARKADFTLQGTSHITTPLGVLSFPVSISATETF